MSIKTLCEVCGRAVAYTDPAQQVAESIDNPCQFCQGHIHEPCEDAIKKIMKILRAHRLPNNRFFISKLTGGLISSAYLNPLDGYLPSIPRNSYEIGVGKDRAHSYVALRAHLHEMWIEAARIEEGL